MTPKIVMFTMDVGDAPSTDSPGGGGEEGGEASHNKLEDMIKELSTALTGEFEFERASARGKSGEGRSRRTISLYLTGLTPLLSI